MKCEEGESIDIHLLHGRAKHQLLITCQTKDLRHDCLQKGSSKCGISDVSKANIRFEVYKTVLLKLRISKVSNYGSII